MDLLFVAKAKRVKYKRNYTNIKPWDVNVMAMEKDEYCYKGLGYPKRLG